MYILDPENRKHTTLKFNWYGGSKNFYVLGLINFNMEISKCSFCALGFEVKYSKFLSRRFRRCIIIRDMGGSPGDVSEEPGT